MFRTIIASVEHLPENIKLQVTIARISLAKMARPMARCGLIEIRCIRSGMHNGAAKVLFPWSLSGSRFRLPYCVAAVVPLSERRRERKSTKAEAKVMCETESS